MEADLQWKRVYNERQPTLGDHIWWKLIRSLMEDSLSQKTTFDGDKENLQ